MSKRLSWYAGLTALLAAVTLGAQAQPLTGGLLGRPTADYSYIPAPSGCASGLVPYFDASLQLVCSPTVYAPATNTTTAGTVVAKNLTATGLATPGSITVTSVLSRVATITTVAGSALADGDHFAVEYGPGLTVPVEFDATPGDGTTGGRVPLVFAPGDSADDIRDAIIVLLNGAAPAALTASSGGAATVALVLDTPGAGGGPLSETVTDAGFAVAGFADPTAATTYTYRLVWRLPSGATTEGGAASSTAAGHLTLSVANRNDLSWSAGPAGTVTDVYRTVGGATQGIIYSGTATALSDTGLAGGGETAPTVDGTGRITSDALTPGGVAIVGAGGRVETDAGLTYDAATDTLTVGATGGLHIGASLGISAAPSGGLLFNNGAANKTPIVFAGFLSDSDNSGNYHFGIYQSALALDLADTASIRWVGNNNVASGTPDSGLRRVSPGLVGVTDGSTGNGVLQTGGVQCVTGSRPTCDAAARGMTWYVAGGAGAADTIEVCGKSAADSYSWVALATF